MGKNNGSNNIPGWVKRDLQMLKRVSVSLVDMQRDNQRWKAENEKILAEVIRRADNAEEQTASLKEQTVSLKRMSDIHSKAILKLLKNI